MIQSQPTSKQTSMATWFKNLMEGIERNLLTKNRDRFTQNLSVFRRDINDSLKGTAHIDSSSAAAPKKVVVNGITQWTKDDELDELYSEFSIN